MCVSIAYLKHIWLFLYFRSEVKRCHASCHARPSIKRPVSHLWLVILLCHAWAPDQSVLQSSSKRLNGAGLKALGGFKGRAKGSRGCRRPFNGSQSAWPDVMVNYRSDLASPHLIPLTAGGRRGVMKRWWWSKLLRWKWENIWCFLFTALPCSLHVVAPPWPVNIPFLSSNFKTEYVNLEMRSVCVCVC